MRYLAAAAGAICALAAGEAQAAKLIAVLPLDTRMTKGKLDDAAQASLEEMLRDTATNELTSYGWTVLTGETTIQVLRDNGVNPEQCGNQSCHLEMAREIKAEKFLSGNVQFVEGEFIASVRLIDTQSGRILTSERVEGQTTKQLRKEFEARASGFFRRGGLLSDVPPPGDTARTAPVVDGNRPQVKKSKVTEAVGSLTVTARPKDAVRLELVDPGGKQETSGAPYENKAAAPGRWRIIAKASGYEEQEQSVEVPPDDVTLVKFELKALGGLTVSGEPLGSAVEVSGPGGFRDDGGLPWEATGLRSGSYEVKVSRNGYAAVTRLVQVTPGHTATVNVVLQKGSILGSAGGRVEPKSGLEFVALPGGSFRAGCESGDSLCDSDEKPAREVNVAAFSLGKTEVTVDAYARCVRAGACTEPKDGGSCNWGKSDKANHPINCVNWEQANAFCRWIGGRLPTPEEWEYAAKGGESRIYPWGNQRLSGELANFCEAKCYEANSYMKAILSENDGWGASSPVGSYPKGASKHGLLDLMGNVEEWTSATYGSSGSKEVRGGGWDNDNLKRLRASFRGNTSPDTQYFGTGLRCAL
jgi:formylglycine-generating enzyme required for sulfatase activity/TolB-like protein